MANGFTYKCSLDPNVQEPLDAYKLGTLENTWLSREAASLSILVGDSERKSWEIDPKTKKRKNHLLMLVAHSSGLKRRFESLTNPKHGYEHMTIHVYHDYNDPHSKTQFTFRSFKQLGKPQDLGSQVLYTFDYDSMDVTGQRG